MEYSLQEYYSAIDDNIKTVRDNIAESAIKAGRDPADVRLMAVTKTVDINRINHALAQGIDLIGENRVQELLEKNDGFVPSDVEKHLIGHLQSNKVAKILPFVSLIESADSVGICAEISKRAAAIGKTQDVLIELNIAGEESKTGLQPEMLDDLLAEVSRMSNIRVRGIMGVPPICEDEITVRRYFSKLHQIFVDKSSQKTDNIRMEILSMGMSGDYAWAVAEGATEVRVGSAIFGIRRY
ncbi:MAG: YggS family pyridoxal phosphate-dependent enzyme [Clostridia bacterium]|nr:YggS family pyridoxal phosphate-dependent enzyme [Clostridia bacterium]